MNYLLFIIAIVITLIGCKSNLHTALKTPVVAHSESSVSRVCGVRNSRQWDSSIKNEVTMTTQRGKRFKLLLGGTCDVHHGYQFSFGSVTNNDCIHRGDVIISDADLVVSQCRVLSILAFPAE